jgi:hypothetical protein
VATTTRADSLDEAAKEYLLDILDARIDINATIIVGQRAVSEWHDWLDSPLIADAIMDRLVQRAHQGPRAVSCC